MPLMSGRSVPGRRGATYSASAAWAKAVEGGRPTVAATAAAGRTDMNIRTMPLSRVPITTSSRCSGIEPRIRACYTPAGYHARAFF